MKKEMTEEQKKHSLDMILDAINFVGTAAKLSRALDVTPATVSNWVNGKTSPGMANAYMVQKITKGKVKREQIRPDLFF